MKSIREKIKWFYDQQGIEVENRYIDNVIMKDKQRVKEFMMLIREEETKIMNYIFEKPEDNTRFTEFELKTLIGVDLYNKKLVELIKKMWAKEVLGRCV